MYIFEENSRKAKCGNNLAKSRESINIDICLTTILRLCLSFDPHKIFKTIYITIKTT